MDIVFEEIKNRNHKTFKKFFNTNYADLVTYAHKYVFDTSASEDIVQEVFVFIWENAENLSIDVSLRSYIIVMVRHQFLKTINITDEYDILQLNIQLTTDDIFDTEKEGNKRTYHQVLKIIETLPEKMQQVVKLKFIRNYKYKDISEELNISVNTVKTHLKRAKSIIMKSMISVLILLLHHQ